jgi:hypothetical protein
MFSCEWGLAMTETIKLRQRVGPHEFEAEGPRDYVDAKLARWEELIRGGSVSIDPAKPPAGNGLNIPPAQLANPDGGGVHSDLAPVFDTSDTRIITLRACPTGDQTESDAILLLAYGYRRLQSHESTLSTQLAESLRLSGVPIYRMDRATQPLVDGGFLLNAGGRAKAKRYRLTATGVTRAENVAKNLMAKL